MSVAIGINFVELVLKKINFSFPWIFTHCEAFKYLDKIFSLIFICFWNLTLSQDLKQTYWAFAKKTPCSHKIASQILQTQDVWRVWIIITIFGRLSEVNINAKPWGSHYYCEYDSIWGISILGCLIWDNYKVS